MEAQRLQLGAEAAAVVVPAGKAARPRLRPPRPFPASLPIALTRLPVAMQLGYATTTQTSQHRRDRNVVEECRWEGARRRCQAATLQGCRGSHSWLGPEDTAREMLEKQGGGDLTTKGVDRKIRDKDTVARGNDPRRVKG